MCLSPPFGSEGRHCASSGGSCQPIYCSRSLSCHVYVYVFQTHNSNNPDLLVKFFTHEVTRMLRSRDLQDMSATGTIVIASSDSRSATAGDQSEAACCLAIRYLPLSYAGHLAVRGAARNLRSSLGHRDTRPPSSIAASPRVKVRTEKRFEKCYRRSHSMGMYTYGERVLDLGALVSALR